MEKSFYKNYFEIEKEHWLMVVRREIVRDNLNFYLNKNPNETKVLDFGCGSGILVDELAKQNYQAYGVDNSKKAIGYGNVRGTRNLGLLDTKILNFSDNTFDVVSALDVLEHLEDETWALKEIMRVLKPEGVAIIMVPAYMFLWGVQDEAAHHYRRYTKNRLLAKIKETTNFKVLKTSYFNTFLFPSIALIRIIGRIFSIHGRKSDFDINSPLLNKLFLLTFNNERKLLRHINFPFGVSILITLKKENDSLQ